jgi:hypothetical protein
MRLPRKYTKPPRGLAKYLMAIVYTNKFLILVPKIHLFHVCFLIVDSMASALAPFTTSTFLPFKK